MLSEARGRRTGFTLTEVLVVLAIIAVLICLLLPAVQRVRETASQARCDNNLRQIGLGLHQFHDANDAMPPYWAAFPRPDSPSIKGCWFDHLLPYVEQAPLYNNIMADIQKTGSNWDGYDVTVPVTVQQWVQDAAGYWVGPPATWVWDVPPTPEQVLTGYNGHTHWETVWVGGKGHWQDNGGVYHPATGHYVSVQTTQTQFIDKVGGIYMPGAAGAAFSLLQCPSDPSPGSYPDAGRGVVYTTQSQSWGSTNYLANWHAFAGEDPDAGYQSPPQRFANLTDGLSNTILFAEGYSWCDGKGRVALNAWDYHSFGLTWAVPSSVVDIGSGPENVNFPNGMPNTLMFQARPRPLSVQDCPAGADCCNNWRAQTGHYSINVCLADGSVRSVSPGLSQQTWDRLLLPRDGQVLGKDW
jgi:prepilin-type N-terminal cleavage/methylation domain-containing protein